jgi:hypothetical protein
MVQKNFQITIPVRQTGNYAKVYFLTKQMKYKVQEVILNRRKKRGFLKKNRLNGKKKSSTEFLFF